jgi:hypothetical protein
MNYGFRNESLRPLYAVRELKYAGNFRPRVKMKRLLLVGKSK